MKQFQCHRLRRVLSIALISSAGLYGVTNQTPANAGAYIFTPNEKLCMADAYLLEPGNSLPQDKLNCTANDVEITQVIPLDPNAECTLGQTFSFQADVTVRTNANERYDTTFYLPLTEASPQVVQGNVDNCSMILPIPGDSGETADVELDGDACGDISKALNGDQYTLTNETITMLCSDEDNDNRADFTYCAAWDNQKRNNCTVEEDPYSGQIPNTKSKCNCDTFNIDVFIKPNPPQVVKTLTSTDTRTEPGGTFEYTVSFTNPNDNTSIFITSLSDEIDIGGEGSFDTALDLWGTPAPADLTTEGVYLTASNCSQPANGGEIGPSGTYSCAFTVHIVDRDLPDDQSPEFYDDLVKLSLVDKNNDPVVDGDTCSAVGGNPGDHCSNEITVQITNLPPAISVVKTASPTEILEPGDDVSYTVEVTNNSGDFDSPVTLTSLLDDQFGDLNGKGTCVTGGTIAFGATYSCTFTEFIAGDQGTSHTNKVTAKATDDEQDEAIGMDTAVVAINDVPSAITLIKTANPTQVLETGDDPSVTRTVAYTFEFGVVATGVDEVTFSSLTDTKFGDITAECLVSGTTPLLGFMLLPGETASCTINKEIRGEADTSHDNIATIAGTDEDGQAVEAIDDASVTFLPAAPDTDMAFATSLLVVLELTNAGIENVTLTSLTVKGLNMVDGTGNAEFVIRNSAGGSHAGVAYPACSLGVVLGFNGSGTETYSCAFTIELKPGIENTDNITFLAAGVNGIVATVTDNDGATIVNGVSVEVNTVE